MAAVPKLTSAVLISAVASAATAADRPRSNPLVDALARCLEVREDAARLACTDAAGRRLVDAERGREVVVVDRQEVARARRSLFGLPVETSDVFAGRDRPADRIAELATVIRSAGGAGHGRWNLLLAEGGRWRTVDPWPVSDPEPGQKITVRRGSLGSYSLKAEGGRWIAARRVD